MLVARKFRCQTRESRNMTSFNIFRAALLAAALSLGHSAAPTRPPTR